MGGMLCVDIYICMYTYIGYKRPELRDVCKYVIPEYAHNWRSLGELLHFKPAKLEIIFSDCRNDCKKCCRRLLSSWLEKDPNASWDRLLSAIDDLHPLSEIDSQGMNEIRYCTYSLKLLRTKIFMDIVVFEVPTNFLSMKILYIIN